MPVALAFAIIKLKTKQAQLAQIELTRRTLNQCTVNDEARCNVPAELPCAKVCPVFGKSIGKG